MSKGMAIDPWHMRCRGACEDRNEHCCTEESRERAAAKGVSTGFLSTSGADLEKGGWVA